MTKMLEASLQQTASRLIELDELYLSLYKVTGFTAEQLLEMFMAGCTIKQPEQQSLTFKYCSQF